MPRIFLQPKPCPRCGAMWWPKVPRHNLRQAVDHALPGLMIYFFVQLGILIVLKWMHFWG